MSPALLQNLRARLEQTRSVLNSGDASLIGALSREEVLGDMFYAGALGYFGEYLGLSHVSALSQQARHGLLYGYGTLGYEPNIQMLFGLPRAITPGGIGVNVRLSWANQPKDGDIVKWRNLNRQSGILASSLEHGVPEQMFSTPTQPAQGVSAVKALQLAAQQGQRIYHITQQNQAQTLPNLHVGGLTLTEIQKGLATGKEVIAHTDPISVSGWTGEGYLIIDPETGSGAYKITGGSNGGWYSLLAFGTASIFAVLGFSLPLINIYLIIALAALFVATAMLALIHGVNFDEYFSSVEYMGGIVTAAHLFRALATGVTLLGAAGFVPLIVSAFVLITIVVGIIKLLVERER